MNFKKKCNLCGENRLTVPARDPKQKAEGAVAALICVNCDSATRPVTK